MIELFQHLFHLDFDWLFLHYETSIYVVLFLVIFIETGVLIMPFLPGDSLLFTAGLFAAANKLELSFLLPLLMFAAVLGDNCNYWMGRIFGLKVFDFKIKGKNLINKKYLQSTEAFFEKKWCEGNHNGSFCANSENVCSFCGRNWSNGIQEILPI